MSKNYDGAFLRNYKIAKSSNQREKLFCRLKNDLRSIPSYIPLTAIKTETAYLVTFTEEIFNGDLHFPHF